MRFFFRVILLLGLPLIFLFSSISRGRTELNVYDWAAYMPLSVIKQFEHETGIQVNYTEYDSNETLYSKLKSNPHLGYDVIFPSSYYVFRMARENMLLPLDHSKLPNIKNLNPELLNQAYDPLNKYSLPYLWGTTAIVVNESYLDPKKITAWKDFWQPQFKNQLLLFDDMREIFAIALVKLGYNINETDPRHIEEAYQQLKLLWQNIKLLSGEAEQNIYIDEDAYIGMGYNGEIYNAQAENKNLVYIYPEEGYELWVDCMVIAKYAPHPKAALAFINFLLRPDIAAQISKATGFSTPNSAAISYLPKAMRQSKLINPPNSIVRKGKYLMDLGDANRIYEKYWNLLKVGE